MPTQESAPTTLLEGLQKSLAAAGRHAPGEVAPVTVLWPDPEAQWQALVPQLQHLLPELLVLGPLAHEERRGPAIWLRCVIERTLPEPSLPEGKTPIIYMPRVSRQTLRAVDDCPDDLKPLVELQFRGAVWSQRNGRDWTVEAFMVSEESGLGLDVAKDLATRRAMLGALPQLAVTSLFRLRDKRLEADDFDRLMIDDTPRNLLEWLSEPVEARKRWDAGRWAAFCSRCRADYEFDPEKDGEVVAGEQLGTSEGPWAAVWERFSEAPSLYPGIPTLLRRSKPFDLPFRKETWPDENDAAEKSLRSALVELADLPAVEARARLAALESEHGARREWVWARLGMASLARALEHLAVMARHTATALGGDSPKQMAASYVQGPFLADDAALRALAEAKSAEDWKAVTAAIQVAYLPWLNDAAEHFQKLVNANPLPSHDPRSPDMAVEPGTCVMFVDGLRFDLGMRLTALAQARNLRATTAHRWAALPTVTATAKPAVSPIGASLSGNRLGADFCADVSASDQPLTSARFKELVLAAGFQWLSDSDLGNPFEGDARAWTEYGEFDKLGHGVQAKLAAQIDSQLELLVERIAALLLFGWKRVRVVTDHGWLLVPGDLPSMLLPKYLTESRWSRCAAVKPGAQVQTPVANWYWNSSEVFAYATGARCFGNGRQYAHGGLSLQECLVPDLFFESESASAEVASKIADIQWLGLRCRITVEASVPGLTADIRTRAGDPATSLAQPKPVDATGRAGLLVEDESLEGSAVLVVLLDTSGRVVSRQSTTVGGER